jgi:hypothetical protein
MRDDGADLLIARDQLSQAPIADGVVAEDDDA